MKRYLKGLLIFCTLCSINPIQSKILTPNSSAQELMFKSDEELKRAFNQRYKELQAPAKVLPEGIETDIATTQQPSYKINMLNKVIEEIARRCKNADTIEKLSTLADTFFITPQITQ